MCIVRSSYKPGTAPDAKIMAPIVKEVRVKWRGHTFTQVNCGEGRELQTPYSLTQPWLEKIIRTEANNFGVSS